MGAVEPAPRGRRLHERAGGQGQHACQPPCRSPLCCPAPLAADLSRFLLRPGCGRWAAAPQCLWLCNPPTVSRPALAYLQAPLRLLGAPTPPAAVEVAALDAAMPFDFEHQAARQVAGQQRLKIGIVGFGNFGQFLARRFVKAGHEVRGAGRGMACIQSGSGQLGTVRAWAANHVLLTQAGVAI